MKPHQNSINLDATTVAKDLLGGALRRENLIRLATGYFQEVQKANPDFEVSCDLIAAVDLLDEGLHQLYETL